MGVFGNDREYDFLCVGVFPSVFVLYICVCMCVCSTEGEGERGKREMRKKFLFWVGNINKRQKP